jgi:hypothetical protein
LFVDYTGAFNDDDHEGLDGDKSSGGVKLSLNRCFHDERWTKNRVITSMDWFRFYRTFFFVADALEELASVFIP